jgi:acyl transferase domain-containing protein
MGAAAAVLLGSATRSKQQPLTVASDKSGIGHTEPAAGLAGVVHAVLASSCRMALPVLHLRTLNPYLDSTLAGVSASINIPRQPRGALLSSSTRSSGSSFGDCLVTGVSSFAFQGTNAHLLLAAGSTSTAAATAAVTAAAQQRQQLMQQKYLSVLAPAHSLVWSAGATLSGTSRSVRFEVQLSHPSVAWLYDHMVGGRLVLPGAAYLEVALAAGRQLLGSGYATDMALAAVSISAPLVLPEGPAAAAKVQLAVSVDPATGVLSIASSSSSSSAGSGSHAAASTTHVSGSLVRISSSADGSLQALQLVRQQHEGGIDSSFDRIAAKGLQPLGTAGLYADLAKAGLNYGPAFRLLRNVKYGASDAAAQLQPMSDQGERPLHSALHADNCTMQPGV